MLIDYTVTEGKSRITEKPRPEWAATWKVCLIEILSI